MELEFTADGAGGDAELFIHLDVEGLAALLRAVEAAMTSGRGELVPEVRDPGIAMIAGGSAAAFGKVTVTFDGAGNSGERIAGGAWIIPEASPASLELPGRR